MSHKLIPISVWLRCTLSSSNILQFTFSLSLSIFHFLSFLSLCRSVLKHNPPLSLSLSLSLSLNVTHALSCFLHTHTLSPVHTFTDNLLFSLSSSQSFDCVQPSADQGKKQYGIVKPFRSYDCSWGDRSLADVILSFSQSLFSIRPWAVKEVYVCATCLLII